MKIFLRLYQQSSKLTLFTRANCSLCETAKRTIEDVRKRHLVPYEEVDVMARGNERWKIYEFDVPVVRSSTKEFCAKNVSLVFSYTSRNLNVRSLPPQ